MVSAAKSYKYDSFGAAGVCLGSTGAITGINLTLNDARPFFQGLRSGAGGYGVIFYAGGEGSNDWGGCADEFSDADIVGIGHPNVARAVDCDACRVVYEAAVIADGRGEKRARVCVLDNTGAVHFRDPDIADPIDGDGIRVLRSRVGISYPVEGEIGAPDWESCEMLYSP